MEDQTVEVTEAELEIMKVLWNSKTPIALQAVCDAIIDRHWKYTTVATMLTRLVKKNAVSFDKKGNMKYYYAVLQEEAYKKAQTKNLITKLYHGSVKQLAVSLFQSGNLSEAEIEEIKHLIDM